MLQMLNDPIFENNVIAVFMLNAKNRSFVPSTHNYIAGQHYEHVMCDSGSGSFLLPIFHSDELLAMRQRFPASQYLWKFRGVTGTSVTLRISHRLRMPFNITLGTDIGGKQFKVPFLRFYICGDDVRFLLAVANLPEASGGFQSFMSPQNIAALQKQQLAASVRRHIVLMGQALLHGRHYWTATDNFTYVFAAWPSHALYAAIGSGAASHALDGVQALLPADFNELEDEDHGDSDSDFYVAGDVEGDSGDEEE
eukprot:gene38627-46957_t